MKSFVTASLCLIATGFAQAEEPRYVNADGSALSEMCIAALESPAAMRRVASEHGLQGLDNSELACNGMPVERFVASARARAAASPVSGRAPGGLAFNGGDRTPETALCVASVTSAERYASLKETYFNGDSSVEEEVYCNGEPLKRFVRKYGNETLTASL